jgi:peptide/nickel transport system permease protein
VTQYLVRRLLIAIPSLLGISVILFTVLALAPGDPFEELASNPAVPPDVRAALRASLGLDDPIHERYISWLLAMLRGEWGYSFVSRIPVDDLILQRLPTTLLVIGASQILALAIALPVGVYAATRPYSVFDQIANTLAFIGFSLPTFFTGLLLILLFSITLDWLPFVYRTNIEATGWRWWWEQFPAIHHADRRARPVPGCRRTRFVRSACSTSSGLDHVTTARSRASPKAASRAPISCATPYPRGHAGCVADAGGVRRAIVTEQIFRVPGIGSLLISAILANDTPVIMAVTFVTRPPLSSFSTCSRHPVWLARSSHQLPLAPPQDPGRGLPARASGRGRRRGAGSASIAWRW